MDPNVGVVLAGLPLGTTMGDVETLLRPLIKSRIAAISLQGEGTAVVELKPADAENCLGEHEFMGAQKES